MNATSLNLLKISLWTVFVVTIFAFFIVPGVLDARTNLQEIPPGIDPGPPTPSGVNPPGIISPEEQGLEGGSLLLESDNPFNQALTQSIQQVPQRGLVTCFGQKAPNCTFADFVATLNKVVEFFVIISASVATIMFVVAGWMYMTAGGDTGKISQAHKIFKVTAVGFVIVLSAWLIVKMLLTGLQADPDLQKALNDNNP